MDGEGFGESLADGHAGVEGGVGVLEDDGQFAAEATEVFWWKFSEIEGGFGGGVVEDLAGGGFYEAEKDAREGGFAGAGFTYEAEGLAAGEGEGDVVDDAGFAVGFGEVDGGEEGVGHGVGLGYRMPVERVCFERRAVELRARAATADSLRE